MDWISIIGALISALAGGGLISLLTIRETRKAKKLENVEKEFSLEDQRKDEIINDWKSLADQRKQDLIDFQSRVGHLRESLDNKDKTIIELKNQILELSTALVKANIFKCTRIECERRKPPFMMEEVHLEDKIDGLKV